MKEKKILFMFVITVFLSLTQGLSAVTGFEDLKTLIEDINQKQANRMEHFQIKLEDYFFNISGNSIKKLLENTTPGEAVAMLCFSKLSGQSAKKTYNSRKQKDWEEILKEVNVNPGDMVNAIEKFRNTAGC